MAIQQERLSALRPAQEFFDVSRISRPTDLNVATSRITYNTRFFGSVRADCQGGTDDVAGGIIL